MSALSKCLQLEAEKAMKEAQVQDDHIQKFQQLARHFENLGILGSYWFCVL